LNLLEIGNYQLIIFSVIALLFHSFCIHFFSLCITTIQEIITATQPTTIKVMAASLFLHSVVINFALTIEKQEQQQPILLQSTTPKHGHWTCFIQL
jgi:positive regulator of sigma E activity